MQLICSKPAKENPAVRYAAMPMHFMKKEKN